MKMRYIIIPCLFLLLSMVSCRKTETKESVPVNFAMQLTASDTLEARLLVDTYMQHVVNGDYGDAVAMLYVIPDNDPKNAPELLDNGQIAETMNALRALPVKAYSVRRPVFREAYKNEVRCEVTLESGLTLNWSFKPVRYLGQWYLCLRDTSDGDNAL